MALQQRFPPDVLFKARQYLHLNNCSVLIKFLV